VQIKDLFTKKKYATIPSEPRKREVPEGLMNKCSKCGTIQYSKELEKNLKVCSSCGHHHRLSAWERIALTLDEGHLLEYDANMESVDPLNFPGYASKLEQQRSKSRLREAVVTGEGTIGGRIVIEQTIRQKLPDDFQTAEFNLQHGQLDKVVHRKDMKPTLAKLLDMHCVREETSYGG
jgi:acetyl-CoA carboxylase beta subunit